MLSLIMSFCFILFFLLSCIAISQQWRIVPLFLIIMGISCIGAIISLAREKKLIKGAIKEDPSKLFKL
jgi:hypothetical protein